VTANQEAKMSAWGWKRRLAVVITGLWLVFLYAKTSAETRGVFYGLGIVLAGLLWGWAWVWRTYQARRQLQRRVATRAVQIGALLVCAVTMVAVTSYVSWVRGPEPGGASLAQMFGIVLRLSIFSFIVSGLGTLLKRSWDDAAYVLAACGCVMFGILTADKYTRATPEETANRQATSALIASMESQLLREKGASDKGHASQPPVITTLPSSASPASVTKALTEQRSRPSTATMSDAEITTAVQKILEQRAAKNAAREPQRAAQLAALEPETLLKPEFLLAQNGIVDARRRLAAYRSFLVADEQDNLNEAAWLLSETSKWPMDGAQRRAFVASSTASRKQYGELWTAYFAAARAVIDAIADAVEFLASVNAAQGLTLVDGKLIFREPSDLEQYRRLISEVESRGEASVREETKLTKVREEQVAQMKRDLLSTSR
jgi:hypothetical protein